jgi:tripartite-type tricarboxylate transporter receptor subunit TctC
MPVALNNEGAMDRRTTRRCTLVVAFASVITLYAPIAQAGEPWPQRPVRVITPFSAGADVAARPFAEQLSKRWKQPVVIENRPGAEGLIGVSAFTSARDDHTLF